MPQCLSSAIASTQHSAVSTQQSDRHRTWHRAAAVSALAAVIVAVGAFCIAAVRLEAGDDAKPATETPAEGARAVRLLDRLRSDSATAARGDRQARRRGVSRASIRPAGSRTTRSISGSRSSPRR